MNQALTRALILETPTVIHGWGFQVFVPQRDLGNVASMNEIAIEMHSAEAAWIADLSVDAVRRGILPPDVLKMWVWPRAQLRAQIRDNRQDAATFRQVCEILADDLEYLDQDIAATLKPSPVTDDWMSWEELRAVSRESFADRKWVDRAEACHKLGISERTLKRWAAEKLIAPRPVGGKPHWNLEALYFARVINQYRAVQGRKQNRDRGVVEVLDEVLDNFVA